MIEQSERSCTKECQYGFGSLFLTSSHILSQLPHTSEQTPTVQKKIRQYYIVTHCQKAQEYRQVTNEWRKQFKVFSKVLGIILYCFSCCFDDAD